MTVRRLLIAMVLLNLAGTLVAAQSVAFNRGDRVGRICKASDCRSTGPRYLTLTGFKPGTISRVPSVAVAAAHQPNVDDGEDDDENACHGSNARKTHVSLSIGAAVRELLVVQLQRSRAVLVQFVKGISD